MTSWFGTLVHDIQGRTARRTTYTKDRYVHAPTSYRALIVLWCRDLWRLASVFSVFGAKASSGVLNNKHVWTGKVGLKIGLAARWDNGAHLQDNLLGGLVGVEEVADVEEGIVLGGAVVALEMVPAELDELLAVLHQLLRRAPDQQRRQLQQLHLHALPIRACEQIAYAIFTLICSSHLCKL